LLFLLCGIKISAYSVCRCAVCTAVLSAAVLALLRNVCVVCDTEWATFISVLFVLLRRL
jgi:hypothetical protein